MSTSWPSIPLPSFSLSGVEPWDFYRGSSLPSYTLIFPANLQLDKGHVTEFWPMGCKRKWSMPVPAIFHPLKSNFIMFSLSRVYCPYITGAAYSSLLYHCLECGGGNEPVSQPCKWGWHLGWVIRQKPASVTSLADKLLHSPCCLLTNEFSKREERTSVLFKPLLFGSILMQSNQIPLSNSTL